MRHEFKLYLRRISVICTQDDMFCVLTNLFNFNYKREGKDYYEKSINKP